MKAKIKFLRALFVLAALACALALPPAPSTSAQLPDRRGLNIRAEDGKDIKLYDKSYALVVGVSDYAAGWPKLPGVKKDIEEVARALERHGFQVTKVENPDSVQLDKAFKTFIDQNGLGVENRLLFYFAGHGHTIKQSYGEEMGYIVPVDAPNPTRDPAGFMSKAMDMQQMELYARRIQSKHALFLFDSCFSGALFALSRAVPDSIGYKTARPVRQFITSGSADEQVPDQSIFRRQFVEAIEGEADGNRDGYVTGTELGEFLQDKVVNYSRNAQHPQYGKIRNPNLDKGDFVFALPKTLKSPPVVASASPTPAPPASPAPVNRADMELAFWDAIKDGKDPEDFKEYLDKYPAGQFAGIARRRLASLNPTIALSAGDVVAVFNSFSFSDEKAGVTRLVKANKTLESEFKPLVDELQQLQNKYDILANDIKQTENSADAQALKRKVDEAEGIEKEIKRKKDDGHVVYDRRYKEVTDPIFEDISTALEQFKQRHGITKLLNLSEVAGAVLVTDNRVDITAAFVAEFNANDSAADDTGGNTAGQSTPSPPPVSASPFPGKTVMATMDTRVLSDGGNGIARFAEASQRLEKEFRSRNARLQQLENLQASSEKNKRTYERYKQDLESDYKKRSDEVFDPVYADVRNALQVFAKGRSVSLIFDTGNSSSIPLDIRGCADLTREFIADYNAKHPL